MLDSSISQSRRVEMERELEPWIPDEDDPQCPELENIFDGHWNRLLYSNFLSPNLLVIVQLFNSFSTWFRCHLETIFSIGDLTFLFFILLKWYSALVIRYHIIAEYLIK